MNRRELITMDEAEILAFLDQEKVAVVSSLGPRGWPHSMPLWYVVMDGHIFSWTFTKSQKIKNLERDPRATVRSKRVTNMGNCGASSTRVKPC